MPDAIPAYERLLKCCEQRGCAVQELFLVGESVYIALDGNARTLPHKFQPLLVDDLQLTRELPRLLRRLDAKQYESLDALRDDRVQCDEFHELYDALYDALIDISGGKAPDDEPFFLPGGYQGFPKIQLHVAAQEQLTSEVIERLQAPLGKYQRRWIIRVTSGEMGAQWTIAEIDKARCSFAR
jgi:hypothetical protein